MKPLTPQKQAALASVILATGNQFAEAVTTEPEYTAALELVQRLDVHLTLGTAHFYTTEWALIRTLDEAVNAILAGEFVGTVPEVNEQ